MMLDRCLGLRATEDLLELAGDYLDQVKLSFGTSLLLDETVLRCKIALHRAAGIDVYPGGTLMELAARRRMFGDYVEWSRELGFNAVEISDGIIDMSRGDRDEAIRLARDFGLKVITETGKKDPEHPIDLSQLCDQIDGDLEAGAERVTIEARESGRRIGIYDDDGGVLTDRVEQILQRFDGRRNRLIWEAPRQSQQAILIQRCGVNVNLGNVKPRDVLGLEALRCGLRYETFDLASARRKRQVTEHEEVG